MRKTFGWVLGSLVVLTALTAVVPRAAYSKPTFKSCADAKRIKLQSCEPFVLSDTMPSDDYYENGSRSATSPGAFGLQEDQDEAAGFSTPGTYSVLAESLDLALWFRAGANNLDVYLVDDRQRPTTTNGTAPYEPDDSAVLEHWRLSDRVSPTLGAAGNVVHIDSTIHPRLVAGRRYWVYISVPQPASAIAWMSVVPGFAGPSWFAERNSVLGFQWAAFAQPGFSLRVTALR